MGGDGSGGQAEVCTDGCRGCPEGPQREAAASGQNSTGTMPAAGTAGTGFCRFSGAGTGILTVPDSGPDPTLNGITEVKKSNKKMRNNFLGKKAASNFKKAGKILNKF